MENFYKTYRHFTVSIQKLIKKKTGEKYSSLKELNDIFKYDMLFKPEKSLCSETYFEIMHLGNNKISNKVFVNNILGRVKLTIEPYTNTDIWNEIEKVERYTSEYMEYKHPQKFGIYFLYDENYNIIYIGKSNAGIVVRSSKSITDKNASKISFAYPATISDNNIYEAYYISKYKPKFNKDFIHKSEVSFELPRIKESLIFEIYNPFDVIEYNSEGGKSLLVEKYE